MGHYRQTAHGLVQIGDDAATTAVATAPAPSTLSSLRDAVNSEPVATAAGVAMAYHGYKRTGSLFWALVYAAAGRLFPLETVPIAVAQGFATKKACP